MNKTRNQDPDPELSARIRNLPPLRPRAAYREEARRRFLTGEATAAVPLPSRPVRHSWRWAAMGLATAAVFAIILVVGSGRAPSWRVLAASAQSRLTIDGTPVPARAALGMKIHSGSRIVGCPKTEVTLGAPDGVAFVLAPSAEVVVGEKRRILRSAVLFAQVVHGKAWATTGPKLPSGGIRVRTAEAEVRVTGTTFSVSCFADTTCICVLDGSVEVTCLPTGRTRRVSSRHRLLVSRMPEKSRLESLPSAQAAKLEEVRRRGCGSRQTHL